MTSELKPLPTITETMSKLPKLSAHIERMANTGSTGSLIQWDDFLHTLNAEINTRAVPDVPELVRYAEIGWGILQQFGNGDYVRHDQAVAVIAAKVKIGEQVADKIFTDYTTQLLLKEDAIKRAEAAEAKLAQIEKQEAKVCQTCDGHGVKDYAGFAMDECDCSSDSRAVDNFASAMKSKLAKKRNEGRSGWQHMSADELTSLLREHVKKGDPVDVANLCMMLSENGQNISPVASDTELRSRLWVLHKIEHAKLGEMLLDKSPDGIAAANWQGGKVNGIVAAISALNPSETKP